MTDFVSWLDREAPSKTGRRVSAGTTWCLRRLPVADDVGRQSCSSSGSCHAASLRMEEQRNRAPPMTAIATPEEYNGAVGRR
jgi:hypothetical protein